MKAVAKKVGKGIRTFVKGMKKGTGRIKDVGKAKQMARRQDLAIEGAKKRFKEQGIKNLSNRDHEIMSDYLSKTYTEELLSAANKGTKLKKNQIDFLASDKKGPSVFRRKSELRDEFTRVQSSSPVKGTTDAYGQQQTSEPVIIGSKYDNPGFEKTGKSGTLVTNSKGEAVRTRDLSVIDGIQEDRGEFIQLDMDYIKSTNEKLGATSGSDINTVQQDLFGGGRSAREIKASQSDAAKKINKASSKAAKEEGKKVAGNTGGSDTGPKVRGWGSSYETDGSSSAVKNSQEAAKNLQKEVGNRSENFDEKYEYEQKELFRIFRNNTNLSGQQRDVMMKSLENYAGDGTKIKQEAVQSLINENVAQHQDVFEGVDASEVYKSFTNATKQQTEIGSFGFWGETGSHIGQAFRQESGDKWGAVKTAGGKIADSWGDLSLGQSVGAGYIGLSGLNVARRGLNAQDGLIRDRHGRINNAFTPFNPLF